jgi:hypothetical protein
LEPIIMMQSEFLMSIQWLVIAPLPNDSARAATVAECHIRAQCSMYTSPKARAIFTRR